MPDEWEYKDFVLTWGKGEGSEYPYGAPNSEMLARLKCWASLRICSEKGGQAGINLSAAAVWVTRSANGGIAPRPRSRSRT